MKIALLISGEFREFEIAHKFWPFLQWKDLDIYFSTWSTSNIYDQYNHCTIEKLNYHLMNSVHPKKCIVECQKSTPIVHNSLKMIHRIKKGFELIFNSGIDYDIIIVVRPDFCSYVNSDYYRKQIGVAYKESVCVINGYHKDSSGDFIIIFPIANARNFYNFRFEDEFDFTDPFFPIGNIHKILGNYFYGSAKELPGMSMRCVLVRSNSRKLHPTHQISFRHIFEKSKEWWCSRFGYKWEWQPDYTDPNIY